jgi:general nucleoside transport system permease protein
MIDLIASALRLSTPLTFAALGGLICERSGIATICLEGVMLTAGWSAATVNYYTGDPWLALAAGAMAGALTMGLHAALSVWARADHIISGVVVNIFAAGVTPIFTKVLFGSATNTPSIPMEHRFSTINLGPGILSQVPLVYLGWLLPFAIHVTLYHTRWGLRLWSSGDHPEALQTAGVSFRRVRWQALLLGGAVTSLGGVYLAISHASGFTRGMTAGRGFIALTALIFGKWRPIPTFLACLFFGFADALQIQLQSTSIGNIQFPVQLIQVFPYLITLVVLVVFVGSANPPLTVGVRK